MISRSLSVLPFTLLLCIYVGMKNIFRYNILCGHIIVLLLRCTAVLSSSVLLQCISKNVKSIYGPGPLRFCGNFFYLVVYSWYHPPLQTQPNTSSNSSLTLCLFPQNTNSQWQCLHLEQQKVMICLNVNALHHSESREKYSYFEGKASIMHRNSGVKMYKNRCHYPLFHTNMFFPHSTVYKLHVFLVGLRMPEGLSNPH